jgi:hypothetical protein
MFSAPAWLTAIAQAGVVIFFMVRTVRSELSTLHTRLDAVERHYDSLYQKYTSLESRSQKEKNEDSH